MAKKSSLIKRVSIAKFLGFAIGLLGFFLWPVIFEQNDLWLRWGILLWYTSIGGIIGLMGIMSWHPILKIPLPWYLRDSGVAAWMNFVLVFFAHDKIAALMSGLFGTGSFLSNPFWIVLEGAIIGLIIGYFARRFGGDGGELEIPHR